MFWLCESPSLSKSSGSLWLVQALFSFENRQICVNRRFGLNRPKIGFVCESPTLLKSSDSFQIVQTWLFVGESPAMIKTFDAFHIVQTLFFVWNVWSNILCRKRCNLISPRVYGRRESSLTACVRTSLKTILTMLFQKYGFEKKNIFYGENLISLKCHWSELLVMDGENKTINYLARLLVS